MDVTQRPSAWDVAPACVCVQQKQLFVLLGWFFRPCEVAAGKRVKPPASALTPLCPPPAPPVARPAPGTSRAPEESVLITRLRPRVEAAAADLALRAGSREVLRRCGSGPSSQRLYKWARLCLRAQNWTEGNLLGSTRSRTSC